MDDEKNKSISLGDILWEYADFVPGKLELPKKQTQPEKPPSGPPVRPVQKAAQPSQPAQPVQPGPPVRPVQQTQQPGKSVTPTQPPQQPGQSVAPTQQPQQPGQPVRPAQQPQQPGQPVRPTQQQQQPGQSVAPTQQPQQPGQPVRPTQQPPQPGQPVAPTQQPQQPGQPAAPTQQPQQPGQPVRPTQPPQQPGQPVAPTQQPQQPGQPAAPTQQPQQPGQPVRPAQQPQQPGQSVAPTQQPQQPGQPVRPTQQPQQPSQSGTPGERPTQPGQPFRPGAQTPPPKPEPEKTPLFGKKERKARPIPEIPPDISPSRLAEEYGYDLPGWRKAAVASGVLSAILLVLALPEGSLIPFLQDLIPPILLKAVSLALFLVCALLGRNVLKEGFVGLASKKPNADTLVLFATVFTLLDGVTLLIGFRADSLPLCAPCALALTFRLLTHYCERKGKRDACQVAASAPQLYLVTQDPDTVNGKPVFRKWLSTPQGFGSQIQTQSGQDFRFQRLVPVLLVACLVLGLLTTVAHHQPRLIFWSLSALFTASATLGAGLGGALPFLLLGSRLRKLGSAIAGWPGVMAGKGCHFALLTDADLYPPGTVTVRAVNTFGAVPKERVISLMASVIQAAGSGLRYTMDQLVRQTGAGYMQVTGLTMEKGGIRATSQQGQSVMVGTIDCLTKAGITVPSDVKGRDTLLCVLDGIPIGSVSLRYIVINSVQPSLETMLDNRLSPILATRDLFFTPPRLRVGEEFPLDQLIFPTLAQRIRLSAPVRVHGADVVAVLTREGVAPYAQAVVGANRLRRAARLSGVLSRISACIGVLLAASLSSAGALGAMCALSLSLFLLLWAMPVVLLSLWVVQY